MFGRMCLWNSDCLVNVHRQVGFVGNQVRAQRPHSQGKPTNPAARPRQLVMGGRKEWRGKSLPDSPLGWTFCVAFPVWEGLKLPRLYRRFVSVRLEACLKN